jgi:hypothetical protein
MYSMNTYESDALGGFSPHELVFAKKPKNPLGINLAALTDEGAQSYPEYARVLKERAVLTRTIVQDFRSKQTQQRAERGNQHREVRHYSEGQLVAVLSPTHAALQTDSRKFKHDYIGPLVIQTVLDDTHVLLETLEGQTLNSPYHVNRLKPWQEFHPLGNITTKQKLLEAATRPIEARTGTLQQNQPSHSETGQLDTAEEMQ